jgi:uncharacterized membrane protein YhdT
MDYTFTLPVLEEFTRQKYWLEIQCILTDWILLIFMAIILVPFTFHSGIPFTILEGMGSGKPTDT